MSSLAVHNFCIKSISSDSVAAYALFLVHIHQGFFKIIPVHVATWLGTTFVFLIVY